MNHALTRWLCIFLLSLARLTAGEWGEWKEWTVITDNLPDRSGAVFIRFRWEESGGESDIGYPHEYEVKNTSSTMAAKVSLYMPVIDPVSRALRKLDMKTPAAIHVVPPMGTVKGSNYSPSRDSVYYKDVEWLEETATGDKPAEPPASTIKTPEAEAATGTFEGVPLDQLDALVVKMGNDEDRFMATLEVFKQADWTVPDDVNENDGIPWFKAMRFYLEGTGNPDYHGAKVASYTILSESCGSFKIRFTVVYRPMLEFLIKQQNPPLHISELVRLQPGEVVTNPTIAAPGSAKEVSSLKSMQKPEAKPGGDGTQAIAHSGYWFDPDDKDAKAADPVIYVRIAGAAKRMRLSEAKQACGVPKEVTPGTMSHYNERLDKLIIDRKTHRP